MGNLVSEQTLDVVVDHRLVGLLDEASSGEAKPPAPHALGHWLSTAPGNVYLESDEDVLDARLTLQTWDAPAPFEPSEWERSDVIVMDLPSGILSVDEISAGTQDAVYQLPVPGRWQTRLAWRAEPGADGTTPEASVLVQFWRVEQD